MTIPQVRKQQLRQAIRAHIKLKGGPWPKIYSQFPELSRRSIWRTIQAVRAELAVEAAQRPCDIEEELSQITEAYNGMGRRLVDQLKLLSNPTNEDVRALADANVRLRLEMIDLGIRIQRLSDAPETLHTLFRVVIEETRTLDRRSKARLYSLMQEAAVDFGGSWTPPQNDSSPA